jgi:methyltransferase
VEYGRGHYPVMTVMHTALLVSCLVEVWAGHRRFVPALGFPMLAVVLAAQALRWWCVRTLGPRWNTRVIVIADLPLVAGGPYRWLRHPNYVAVVAEVAALPLVHTAWITASFFTLANAAVLAVRLRCENGALALAEPVAGAGR